MSQKTCLLLKPHVTDANDLVRQQSELKNINGALKRTGLQLLEGEAGIAIKELSESVIERIYEADVLVVDINSYNSSSQYLPFLYYLIGWSHSRWDKTILVAHSIAHLPWSLRMYASCTLAHEGNVWDFVDKFERAVENIVSGSTRRANNPLQDFLQAMERAADQAEKARLKAEMAAREARFKAEMAAKEAEMQRIKEEEIAKLQAELREKERRLNEVRQNPREATEPQRISFRPVTR